MLVALATISVIISSPVLFSTLPGDIQNVFLSNCGWQTYQAHCNHSLTVMYTVNQQISLHSSRTAFHAATPEEKS